MNRTLFNRRSCTAVLLGLVLALPTMAQKKAPPGSGGGGDDTAGAPEKKAPPGQGAEYKPSKELIDQFKEAAEKDQNPKVLLMVGQDARAQGMAPVRTRGADAGGADPTRRGVGDVILDFDKTGIADVLENALGVYLQEGFGEFVDPASLAEAERTEIKNKLGRDDAEGLATMAQKLNADVVIYIRFQELPPAERGENKERFRCVAEVKHLRRRTSRKVTPFDWDGPVDVRNARRYAGVLSEEFMKQYVAMVKGAARGQDVAVRLEKLPSTVSQKQVKTWLGIDGGTVKISDWTADADDLITCEATVRFKGDASDIEDAIRTQSKRDGLDFTLVKAESNRVILTSKEAGEALPLWYAITDPGDKTPERGQFKAMVKKQPQTLSVVVNWLLDPAQYKLDHMKYDFHGSAYYFSGSWSAPAASLITGEPRGENSAAGTQAVSLEKVGNALKDVFSDAGLEIKEFDAANFAATREARKVQSLDGGGGESDLVKVMKQTSNTDLILWAKVRLVRDKELANGNAASMSLTLYDTPTGRYLASANWDGDRTVLKRPDLKGIPPKFFRDAQEGEVVGRYLAGNIMGKWLKKAPVTEFQVHNAKSFEETRAFAEAIGSIQGVTVSNIRHDNAMGSFQITYEGNLDAVKGQIATKSSEYPGARAGKVTEAAAGKIVWTFDKDESKKDEASKNESKTEGVR
jgi:hypothetical protein